MWSIYEALHFATYKNMADRSVITASQPLEQYPQGPSPKPPQADLEPADSVLKYVMDVVDAGGKKHHPWRSDGDKGDQNLVPK